MTQRSINSALCAVCFAIFMASLGVASIAMIAPAQTERTIVISD